MIVQETDRKSHFIQNCKNIWQKVKSVDRSLFTFYSTFEIRELERINQDFRQLFTTQKIDLTIWRDRTIYLIDSQLLSRRWKKKSIYFQIEIWSVESHNREKISHRSMRTSGKEITYSRRKNNSSCHNLISMEYKKEYSKKVNHVWYSWDMTDFIGKYYRWSFENAQVSTMMTSRREYYDIEWKSNEAYYVRQWVRKLWLRAIETTESLDIVALTDVLLIIKFDLSWLHEYHGR